jgi:hypothetical protein
MTTARDFALLVLVLWTLLIGLPLVLTGGAPW